MPVTGVPVTTPQAKKSFFGSSSPQPVVPAEPGEEVAKKGPMSPETLVACADVQLASAFDEKLPPPGRQELLDAAREKYQKALQQAPKNRAALLGLARYYARVEDREKAIKHYKDYLKLYPTDKDVAHEVARAHAQWRDWPGAVAWCEFTLKIDPENLAVRKTMAFCLARDGQWERGFQAMYEVMPEAQARYLMARVLEHQNHIAQSRAQVQLALKADPNYADAREFLAELDQVLTGAPGGVPNPNALQLAGYNEQP